MDRKKLSALAFAGLLAGGAWWWTRRAQVAGALPAPGGGGARDLLEEFAAGMRDAAQRTVETVTDALTPGAWAPPERAAPYLPAIYAAEDAAGAPRNLFARQIRQESNFDPNAVNARSGAQGIAQFMPATAADLGVDPFDPASAIAGMGRYMRWLYQQTGDWRSALAAYNWGIGNLQRKGIGAAPPETLAYVDGIAGSVGLV